MPMFLPLVVLIHMADTSRDLSEKETIRHSDLILRSIAGPSITRPDASPVAVN